MRRNFFHFTRCITSKQVTSWRVHVRIITLGQHISFWRNVAAVAIGESLALLLRIWAAQNLNLRTLALEMNAQLDRLAVILIWKNSFRLLLIGIIFLMCLCGQLLFTVKNVCFNSQLKTDFNWVFNFKMHFRLGNLMTTFCLTLSYVHSVLIPRFIHSFI